ncbi:hypothetical protein FQJ65_02310 [Escherichia coli]|uniref:4-phosphopantetheinyl transferase EntD n=6 Tax=Enterobacteriaceae TaxID=543 RepID=A0A3A6S329_ECOLX|nr:conserved hypothetical protein [Escherichia coli UMNK88]AVM05683.1 hypothetical protein C6P57_18835 [Escherichia coli]EDX39497.1 hypothetical protein EC1011_0457 [Escherichia coli 101-1]EFN7270992.1 hypothetical protein [Escherichia coli O21]EFN8412271.1 hypothetical protein [Escherichia coli O7]EFN8444764.1 hypothetical protein [Escherichia coli O5]EFN8707754.1 hypothetical protein [Escherichia coli O130]EGB66140.1 hypothetical protein ERHG_03025 [Escherichia coli TA007]ENA21114.1 hypot
MTLLLFHTKIKNCICRQQQLPTNQIIDKVHFVYAGCGVNALSGIKNIANSIYCRNLVGLISGAHQAVLRLSSVSNAINP